MNKDIEICIKLSPAKYKKLKVIGFGMEPDKYINKFLETYLFNDPEKIESLYNDNRNLEESMLVDTNKLNIDGIPIKKDDKFDNLINLLNLYSIKQKDISKYFTVGQSSVSLFLKNQNKKSHLYPKFFRHNSVESVLFKIFIDKYINLYYTSFNEDEQESIENYIDAKYTEELDTIIKVIAAKAKEKFDSFGFNVNVFISNLDAVSNVINSIEIDNIKNKDLEYLNSKIDFMLEYL